MRTELHAQQTPAMSAVMGELSRAIEDSTRAVAVRRHRQVTRSHEQAGDVKW